jgi:FkbM family methyltransferase
MQMNRLKKSFRNIVRGFGFDIVRYEPEKHPLARRKRILGTYQINMVLDVGANIGQYGEELREIGYKGKIVSFEPLSTAFKTLIKRSEGDPAWDVHNFALGDKNETASINIAGNSYSSSLLDILPSHIKSAPESVYIGHEEIKVKTLDDIYSDIVSESDRVYLKIDTQGFEENVLRGAEGSLESIDTIQLEMSLTPLYQDGLLFDEMYGLLCQKGYALVALEPGFTDEETGQLLQVDGIFHRM